MKNSQMLLVIILSSLLLMGCQTPTKRETGAVLGGITGGVLGNQVGSGSGRTIAIIAGTLFGAFIGGYIGESMDKNDRYRSQQALENTPTNQRSTWQNPDTGNDYTITPTRTYEASNGPCREYTTEAIIDGKRDVVYGSACRQPDGRWKAQ